MNRVELGVGGLPEALPFAYRMRKPDAMSRPPLLAKGSHRVGVCDARRRPQWVESPHSEALGAAASVEFRPASSIAPPNLTKSDCRRRSKLGARALAGSTREFR